MFDKYSYFFRHLTKYVKKPLSVFILMIQQRITFAEVVENDWFKKGYKPPVFEQPTVSLDDVNSIFSESLVSLWFCCLA